MTTFTKVLREIATQTVPRTSNTSRRIKKPWYNETCKDAVRDRKKLLRTFKTHPTTDHLKELKISRAKTRRIIRQSKRQSWQTYV
jgi:hypothetical protein